MISFPPVTAVNFFIGADMHDSKEETSMSRELIISSVALSLFMQQISLKAGIDTLIIALFVIAGVKIAPLITSFIVR